MLGIRYLKAPPTTYVLHFKRGKVQREGPGLSFFYWEPASTIVAVPFASTDVPFVFNEVSADFQAVALQGQLSFRVSEPKRLAGLLNFAVTPQLRYVSDDPDKLNNRLVHATQILTRAVAQALPLRDLLMGSDRIVAQVLPALRQDAAVVLHGVEVLSLAILAIRPTPEMSKALEAEAREGLQRKADEAIYARRNAAVEQERTIKESELNTEIAVEEKRRQIRETQMAADIAVEQQRRALIDLESENVRKNAETKSFALEATLKPLRATDWRTLMAISGGGDAKAYIGIAFQEMAENAQKIGQLNITPDLLKSLLEKSG